MAGRWRQSFGTSRCIQRRLLFLWRGGKDSRSRQEPSLASYTNKNLVSFILLHGPPASLETGVGKHRYRPVVEMARGAGPPSCAGDVEEISTRGAEEDDVDKKGSSSWYRRIRGCAPWRAASRETPDGAVDVLDGGVVGLGLCDRLKRSFGRGVVISVRGQSVPRWLAARATESPRLR